MACGTPTGALRSGALPEFVRHGETGFLGDSLEDPVRLVPRSAEFDPEHCRAWVEARFSADRMAVGYLSVYRSA